MDKIAWVIGNIGNRIPSDIKSDFQKRFITLSTLVYGNELYLDNYFAAWKLRGDDPRMYNINGTRKRFYKNRKLSSYYSFCNNDYPYISAGALYYKYHFNKNVRINGEKKYEWKLNCIESYIEVIKILQDFMIEKIAKMNVSVETNPSSNVLIGALSRYDQHPIFNMVGIDGSHRICASINTDDLGIFDTSLQNEYVLLETAMKKNNVPSENIKAYLSKIKKFADKQVL